MSEQSAKPYLVRAICEWCADNGLTPYLAVKVNAQTRVPAAFVKNGEIVLNVSHAATRKLTIDNDWIQFNARFNGQSQEVAVPLAMPLLVPAAGGVASQAPTKKASRAMKPRPLGRE